MQDRPLPPAPPPRILAGALVLVTLAFAILQWPAEQPAHAIVHFWTTLCDSGHVEVEAEMRHVLPPLA